MTTPAFRIRTPRLSLKIWTPADAPLLHEALSAGVEHLKPWLPFADFEPKPLAAREEMLTAWYQKFLDGQDFFYGIFNPQETRCLGSSGMHTRLGPSMREIGYWLRADTVGKGLVTEAAAAYTRTAFEIDQAEKVEIHVAVGNDRSAAVAYRLGYTLEGILRRRVDLCGGQKGDARIYGMLADEFSTSPAAKISAEMQAFDQHGNRLI